MYIIEKVKPRQFTKKQVMAFLTQSIVIKKEKGRNAKRTFRLTKWYETLPEVKRIELEKFKPKLEADLVYCACVAKNTTIKYNHFTIPKKAGGVRPIDEPTKNLKDVQTFIRKRLIESVQPEVHTAAYAYLKKRSVKSCRMKHQANNSKWFLHLDFENFFGSLNHEFVMRMMRLIYPYSELSDVYFNKLSEIMNVCFLNDGLPQGTTISPALSNLCMIPFDAELNKALLKNGFVYTRYADDIEISHHKKFNPNQVVETVEQVIRKLNAPLRLKKEKTHFGSINGRNWGLGLMLNRENNLTLGHLKHKELKAEIFNLLMDYKNREENHIPLSDFSARKAALIGKLNYMKYIEPETIYILDKIEKKAGIKLCVIGNEASFAIANIF